MGKTTLEQVRQQIAALQERERALLEKEVGGVIARIQEAIAYYGLTPAQLFGKAASGNADAAKSSPRTPKARKSSTQPEVVESAPRKSSRKGIKVPVKFRDEQGNTWTGRGSRPRWVRSALEAGRKLEDFAV